MAPDKKFIPLSPEEARDIYGGLPVRPADQASWRFLVLRIPGEDVWIDDEGEVHGLGQLIAWTEPSDKFPRKPHTGFCVGLLTEANGFCYDALAVKERYGGGGSMAAAFTVYNQMLYLCLIEQKRLLTGDRTLLSTAGGFVDPNKTQEEQAEAEMQQEAGISFLLGKPFPLHDGAISPATHICDTRPTEGNPDPGARFYGWEINPACIRDNNGKPEFNREVFTPTDKDEVILGARLVPWHEAVGHEPRAMLAAFLLLAWLQRNNRLAAAFRENIPIPDDPAQDDEQPRF